MVPRPDLAAAIAAGLFLGRLGLAAGAGRARERSGRHVRLLLVDAGLGHGDLARELGGHRGGDARLPGALDLDHPLGFGRAPLALVPRMLRHALWFSSTRPLLAAAARGYAD